MPRGHAGAPPGKLKAVARAWATGRGGGGAKDDDVATQNAELPDWLVQRRAPDMVEIAEADANTAALFLALDTQWRRHPMTGQRLGLDYAAIAPTAMLCGFTVDPDIMADIRSMEMAALSALARASR